MIKITSTELSHKTVNVGNQFIIRVQTEEIFPTWGDLRKVTWGELQNYTVRQVETLIIKE